MEVIRIILCVAFGMLLGWAILGIPAGHATTSKSSYNIHITQSPKDHMLYRLPFQYPKELPVTELRDLLNEHSVKLEYNFDADFDDPVKHIVSGTLDDLIGFHRDLDGPGQSFPVDEFMEYVEENRLV